MEFPRMRKDMGLNDLVSIEMPAHMWLSFIAAYTATEWKNGPATAVCHLAQEALLDPVFLNEQLAKMEQEQEQHNAMFHRVTGIPVGEANWQVPLLPPEPPGAEDDEPEGPVEL